MAKVANIVEKLPQPETGGAAAWFGAMAAPMSRSERPGLSKVSAIAAFVAFAAIVLIMPPLSMQSAVVAAATSAIVFLFCGNLPQISNSRAAEMDFVAGATSYGPEFRSFSFRTIHALANRNRTGGGFAPSGAALSVRSGSCRGDTERSLTEKKKTGASNYADRGA